MRIHVDPVVVYIDGERRVVDASDFDDRGGYMMLADGREEFYLFEDSDAAGLAARDYWEDMAENDPGEFACLVGEETLIQWGLGRYAGPGSTQVKSLSEWLDLWLNTPEEHWAGYDSDERVFLCKHPDFSDYTVAYRWN